MLQVLSKSRQPLFQCKLNQYWVLKIWRVSCTKTGYPNLYLSIKIQACREYLPVWKSGIGVKFSHWLDTFEGGVSGAVVTHSPPTPELCGSNPGALWESWQLLTVTWEMFGFRQICFRNNALLSVSTVFISHFTISVVLRDSWRGYLFLDYKFI